MRRRVKAPVFRTNLVIKRRDEIWKVEVETHNIGICRLSELDSMLPIRLPPGIPIHNFNNNSTRS